MQIIICFELWFMRPPLLWPISWRPFHIFQPWMEAEFSTDQKMNDWTFCERKNSARLHYCWLLYLNRFFSAEKFPFFSATEINRQSELHCFERRGPNGFFRRQKFFPLFRQKMNDSGMCILYSSWKNDSPTVHFYSGSLRSPKLKIILLYVRVSSFFTLHLLIIL
jgi:hypothetical protein